MRGHAAAGAPRARRFPRARAGEWHRLDGRFRLLTHSDAQVAEIAGSIRAFGVSNPILIGSEGDAGRTTGSNHILNDELRWIGFRACHARHGR